MTKGGEFMFDILRMQELATEELSDHWCISLLSIFRTD